MLHKSTIAIAITTLSISTNLYATPETTAQYYESILNNPQRLTLFLHNMPKGGDLHNHHGGSSMAENMIQYAKKDHLCIDTTTFTIHADQTCSPKKFLENVASTPKTMDSIIDAWSMRHFHVGKESGHDHFFNSFSKYNIITSQHSGEVLSEIVNRAGKQNEIYLELMVTPDNNASGMLGKRVGWESNLVQLRKKLLDADIANIVNDISKKLDADEAFMKKSLHCNTHSPMPGCDIKLRYLYQVLRAQPPEQVFGQLLAGFEAANKDPRIVGINMVQPEDGPISMRDYDLHMQMVGFLHNLYPHVHISLHAGELTPNLVTDEGLRFHIRDAVEIAHAERIGHGIDIAHENNNKQLLDEMAKKHIAIEINLTSNAEILNISGKKHPLTLYISRGVPVTLSTDDEGVNRTNMTKQYVIAASTFKFSYSTLKSFSRNALTYSFLPGQSLWDDYAYQHITSACEHDTLGSDTISTTCQAFLNKSEKAQAQWELEKRFAKFESEF